VSTLQLGPTTDSVPAARRFVRTQLGGSTHDIDTAVLLVSELVTNAVLHARSAFTVRVEQLAEVVRVEVGDSSPIPPRMHTYSAMSATGRGLRLVERLARAWGVVPTPEGKRVWFEVGEPTEDVWESLFDTDLVDAQLTAESSSLDR
jgi:hypothetical protein